MFDRIVNVNGGLAGILIPASASTVNSSHLTPRPGIKGANWSTGYLMRSFTQTQRSNFESPELAVRIELNLIQLATR